MGVVDHRIEPTHTYLGEDDICFRSFYLNGINLTGLAASAVKFYMEPEGGGSVVISGVAVEEITDEWDATEERSEVKFKFLAAHTANAGTFDGHFVVTDATGPQTYPNASSSEDRDEMDFIKVHIKSAIPTTGAAATFKSIFDVRSYGATGDGVTDDTAAIAAAIAAAITDNGLVWFPQGTYKIDQMDLSGITAVTNSTPYGLTVQGVGRGTKILHSGGANPCINLDADDTDLQVHFRDMEVVGQGNSSTSDAINISRLNRYSTFHNIRFMAFERGIVFVHPPAQGIIHLAFYECQLRNINHEGILVESAYDNALTEVQWFGGYIDNCGKHSIDDAAQYFPMDLRWAHEWSFWGMTSEGHEAGYMRLRANCQSVHFHDCRFEAVAEATQQGSNAILIDSGAEGTKFQGCHIVYDDGEINLFSCSDEVLLRGCRFKNVGDVPTNSIIIGGSGRNAVIEQCTFEDCTIAASRVLKRGDEARHAYPFQEFGANDANPSVSGGTNFKTANTLATTIDDFDDGFEGQEIFVLINDALTTVDFTATNLKRSGGGGDWSPASGDWLTATYDGTNWLCEVHEP